MVMRVVDDTGTLSSLSFSLKRSIAPSERRSGGDQSTKEVLEKKSSEI